MSVIQFIYPVRHFKKGDELAVRRRSINKEAEKALIDYLEKTNRLCSSLFAVLIPIDTTFSNIFFPCTTNISLLKKSLNHSPLKKAAAVFFSILIDLITLAFRLITLLPRAIYNYKKQNSEIDQKTFDKLFSEGVDLLGHVEGEPNIPIRVTYFKNKKKHILIYSWTPLHSYRARKELNKKVVYEISSRCKTIKAFKFSDAALKLDWWLHSIQSHSVQACDESLVTV